MGNSDRVPVAYTIVKAGNMDMLIGQVNEMILQGWIPQGGLEILQSIPPHQNPPYLYQAMIKCVTI